MMSNLESRLAMARGRSNLLAVAGSVKRAKLVVFANRVADLAVRLDRHAVDRILMIGERQHRFLGRQVPHLGGLVAASGEQVLAVGGEGDTEDPIGMVLDGLLQFGVGD